MKKTLLILIFITEIITIKSWFICARFADFFHFSLLDLSLRIDESIHADGGVQIFAVRFFHNKALGIIIDVVRDFLHYWDIVFLANFLSMAGVVGLLFAFWYLFQENKTRRYVVTLFVFTIVVQLIEIFFKPNINFFIKTMFLFVPFSLISLFGWREFIKNNTKVSLWLVLTTCLLSIWWLLIFSDNILSYCVV